MAETRAKRAKRPTWKDAKERLETFDRQGLLELIQHLYNSDKGNQAFLHKRLDLGGDLLEPYKKTLDKCFPGGFKDPFVAQAKNIIASYKKVVGDGPGLAELTVYYCEIATDYANTYGDQISSFYNALCSMYGQALSAIETLPSDAREPLVDRLIAVKLNVKFGYGVDIHMDYLLADYIEE